MIPVSDDNLHDTKPYIVYGLITLLFASFMMEFWYDANGIIDQIIVQYGLIPQNIGKSFSTHWYSFFTYMGLHSGWEHILPNLLFLWIFGNNIEDAFGHVKFLFFFLICGALSGLIHSALHDFSTTYPLIGASGAISGVLGAYFALFPRAKVILFFPTIILFPPAIFFGARFFSLIHIPAAIFLGAWFSLDLYQAFFVGDNVVAFWTHISGFLIGLLSARFMAKDKESLPSISIQSYFQGKRETSLLEENRKELVKRPFEK